MFVDEDGLADDARIFLETPVPKVVAENDDGMRAWQAIVFLVVAIVVGVRLAPVLMRWVA